MIRKASIVLIVAVILGAILQVTFTEPAAASPPSTSPPAAPKTRAQMTSEAYALQAQINAAAGRKTSNASDGTGGTRTTIAVTDTRGLFFDPKAGTCYADSFTAPYVAANACDGDDSLMGTSTWISANSAYPHWVVVNLTASLPVNGLYSAWGNYPPTVFHVDCYVSGVFVAYGNFTATVNDMNKNRSYRLDGNGCQTDRVRIYGTAQSPTATDFMGTFEVSPFHDYPYGSGLFASQVIGMGDWTSQFKSLTWTASGSVAVQVRVSNNSDLTGVSAWHDITSGTDETGLGLIAGFMQYQAYLNTSTSSIAAVVLRYIGQSTGDPPSKTSPGEILHDSHYVHAWFNLTVISRIIVIAANRAVTFDNTRVEFAGGDGLLNVTDESELTGPALLVTVTIRNSTVSNASRFVLIHSQGAIYRAASVDFYMDNATVQHFNSTWGRTIATSPVANAPYVHDSDIFDYNRGNLSFGAVPSSYVFNRVRTIDFRPQLQTYNGVITDQVRQAHFNYMIGGFLQFVYGSDGFGIATGPGYPVEFVNWSYNYAQASKHTVFGTYGTAFGHFADPTLRGGYYQTIYRNYINRSLYIAIQSSGNVSGLRIIGNYIRGPSGSFTEAIGVFEQNHDFLIDRNYLWDLNTVNNRGITITCFVYNVTVSRNVIYDVGVWGINFQCLGLKYKDDGGIERSDYSWRDMNIRVVGNYLAGMTLNAAIELDSGYIQFVGNTIVSSSGGHIRIDDGWACHPNCAYVWVDWIDGYPDGATLNIEWPAVSPIDEKDFWLRQLRSGALIVASAASYPVYANLTIGETTHYGRLLNRCVDSIGGATDAQVLRWTNRPCLPIEDQLNFTFNAPSSQTANHPERWYNKTSSEVLSPIAGNVRPVGDALVSVVDTKTSANVADQSGNWSVNLGHSYRITLNVPANTLGFALDLLPIIAFAGLLVLIMIGAFALKKRRGGSGT